MMVTLSPAFVPHGPQGARQQLAVSVSIAVVPRTTDPIRAETEAPESHS